MIRVRLIYIISIFLLFSCVSRFESSFNINNDKTFLDISILKSKINDDKNKVVLQIEFPINKLIFKKGKNKFISNITVDVLVVNEDNKIVLSDSWNELIEKAYYDDTKSFEKNKLLHEIHLNPGDYKFSVIINDYENHINWIRNSDFQIEENIGFSSMSIFYRDVNIFEEIKGNSYFKDYDTLWVDYSFNQVRDSELQCEIEFIEIIFSDDFLYTFSDSIEVHDTFFSDDINYIDSIESQNIIKKENIVLKDSFVETEKKIPIVLINEYFNLIKIKLVYGDIIISETLSFLDTSDFEYNYSILIGPMYYVLDSDYYEFESMDLVDQKKYMEQYWEKIKDSSNNNELFSEFYKRVLHTNKNFRYLSTEGWDTDKGRVYIINGEPEKISYDFNNQNEFEIWEYDNRHYIFINQGGYYELYNPNYKNY